MLVDSFIVALIVALTGPGLGSLPPATVLLDQAEHRLVVELPAVDVPAATRGEIMVSLPLCRVLVPVSASLHSARVEVVDGSGRNPQQATSDVSEAVMHLRPRCRFHAPRRSTRDRQRCSSCRGEGFPNRREWR